MAEWDSVRVVASALPSHTATSTTLTASTNGAFPGQDGVSLVLNDELLVPNEVLAPEQNGLYSLTQVGSASTPWILTRRSDADDVSDFLPGKAVWIREGGHGKQEWRFVNSVTPTTLGVTALNFEGPEEAEVLPSYIEGLGLYYVDTTTVGLSSGRAYVPGLGKVLTVSADQTATRLSGNNALYYAYLEEFPSGSGLGRLRLITTAPGSPYLGSARTQGNDTTARYLGMLRNMSGGTLLPFEDEVLGGPSVFRLYSVDHLGAEFGILSNATATTTTTANVGPSAATVEDRLVSAAARLALIYAKRDTTSGGLAFVGYPPEAIYNPPNRVWQTDYTYQLIRLSPTQDVHYKTSDGTTGLYLYVVGYYERR